MIFVDTSAWFAANIPTDQNHPAASVWLSQPRERFVTTDYILDELLTLLKARRERDRATHIGKRLLSEADARLVFITSDIVAEAFDIFSRYHDKGWSFTDCTSFVVMQRLGTTKAFTFDHHFAQFDEVEIVPT